MAVSKYIDESSMNHYVVTCLLCSLYDIQLNQTTAAKCLASIKESTHTRFRATENEKKLSLDNMQYQ